MNTAQANQAYLEDALRKGLLLRIGDGKTKGRLTFSFYTNMHGYLETEANALMIARLILHAKNHEGAKIQNTLLSSEAYQDSLFFPEDQHVLWDPCKQDNRKTVSLLDWLKRELKDGQPELLAELEAFANASGY